ncbi:MAG: serine/threonine-protein kinase, partial [Planctomycetota bacterium]
MVRSTLNHDDFHRVEKLFQAAADLPPPDRTKFLGRECQGEVDLQARVQRLLDRLDETLETGRHFGPFPAATITEGPGTTIDRYKLLQVLGEGGFGVVYMAEQQEPVIRKVALKIIKLGMDTREVVARFEAERQALAMMDHPNIAKVLDGGATSSGRPYFVMELVRGVSITEFCDKNDLSTDRRLQLFLQVCNAVQHAHQKGVIHRDLKPSNVLVTLHDG